MAIHIQDTEGLSPAHWGCHLAEVGEGLLQNQLESVMVDRVKQNLKLR